MASGANVKTLWGLELTASGAANFGLGAAKVNKPFGYAQDINPSVERGVSRRGNLGTRSTVRYSRGTFAGSLPVSHDLISPFILELLFGSYAKTGTAGAYIYTFSETDKLPSAELQIAEALEDGNLFRQLLGCTVKSAEINIDIASSDPIRLSMDMAFASEKRSNAIPAAFTSAWTTESKDPLGGWAAKWQVWNGTAYVDMANTDSVDIKIDHGTELKPSLGSEFPTRQKFGARQWDISTLMTYKASSPYMDAFYGAALSATPTVPGAPKYLGAADGSKGAQLILTGPKPATGSAPTYTFEFTGVQVSKSDNPIKTADDELMESVDLLASACSLTVANWPDDEPARK